MPIDNNIPNQYVCRFLQNVSRNSQNIVYDDKYSREFLVIPIYDWKIDFLPRTSSKKVNPLSDWFLYEGNTGT